MNTSLKIILILYFIFLCMLSSSCSMFGAGDKKWKPLKPGSSGYVHLVTLSDENIEIIAKWYTGKSENADKIVEANPTIDPDKIIVGSLVFIPKGILLTTESMPKSHVEDSYKKKTTQKNSPAKKDRDKKQALPSSKDNFQLFGPR